MRKHAGYLLWGALFGFVLSQVRASEFDAIYGMFAGTDLSLAWVILTAIIVGHLGMRWASSKPTGLDLATLRDQAEPYQGQHLVGSALFGVGWALAGACPGTVLAQLGEGKFYALFTVAGLMTGTWLYAVIVEKR